MSATFNFSNGVLDVGTGPVLAPDCTTVSDLVGAGWKPLDAQNGWESFSVDELMIWRHSFAVTARFQEGKFAVVDCIWNDGSWSATDDDLIYEKKTLVKLIMTEAQTTPVATSQGVDSFVFNWGQYRYGPIHGR